MSYYQIVMFTLGWTWLTVMLIRLPAVLFDARIFRRVFKQTLWPRPTLFTISRVIVPGMLGAPFMLWMDPLNFLRRASAPEIWDAAQQLMAIYGEEEDEEPSTQLTTRETP